MDRHSIPRDGPAQARWLRNERWASGVIRDRSGENLLAIWIFTLLWNLVTALALVPRLKESVQGFDPWMVLALVFPTIGVGLLIWAGRGTRRRSKFGASAFHLRTLPATPGGELAGMIHVARKFAGRTGIQLTLVCINRYVTGFGRNTRVIDRVVWQEGQTVDDLPPCEKGMDIPVLFHIPPGAEPSSDQVMGDGFRWKLEARCKTWGVSYYARFDVPVFVIEAAEVAGRRLAAEQSAPPGDLRERGIVCQRTSGRLRVEIGGERRRGLTIRRTILNWLMNEEITVRYGSLTVERRGPMYQENRTFKMGEISGVFVKEECGWSPASWVGRIKKRRFHDVMLKTRDGELVRIAGDITQAEFAAWLAEEIKDTFGVNGE